MVTNYFTKEHAHIEQNREGPSFITSVSKTEPEAKRVKKNH